MHYNGLITEYRQQYGLQIDLHEYFALKPRAHSHRSWPVAFFLCYPLAADAIQVRVYYYNVNDMHRFLVAENKFRFQTA